jgi:hypothetical protein
MSLARLTRPVLILAGAALLCGAAGCGRKSGGTAEVSGTIKIKGKAPNLKGQLEISFLGPDGRLASAPIGENGTFTCPDVPVGDVHVGFIYVPAGIKEKGRTGAIMPTRDGEPKIPPPLPNPIPDEMRDASTSKVIITVKAGEKNVFDYDVRP